MVVTGQMYFPEPINDHIYRTVAAYAGRSVRRTVKNANDGILNHDDPLRLTICRVEPAGGKYSAALAVGIRMPA